MSQKREVLSLYRQCLRLSSGLSNSLQKYIKSRFRTHAPTSINSKLHATRKGVKAGIALSEALKQNRYDDIFPPFRTLTSIIPEGVLVSTLLSRPIPLSFVDTLFSEWLTQHAKKNHQPQLIFSKFANLWYRTHAFESFCKGYREFCGKYKPDAFIINQLTSACRSVKQWSLVLELYQDVTRFRITPDVDMIRSFASAAADGVLVELAESLARQCQIDKIYDKSISGLLIKTFVDGNRIDLAEVLVKWYYASTQDASRYHVLISHLGRVGKYQEAFQYYALMCEANIPLHGACYTTLISGCASSLNLKLGRELHAKYLSTSTESVIIATALVDMYGKCGEVGEAEQVFASMKQKDVAAYNAMIAGYCRTNQLQKARKLYNQMRKAKLQPDHFTYASLFAGCASTNDLSLGQQLHRDYTPTSMNQSVLVCNALIDMYGKCGSVEEAKRVLNAMDNKDLTTYNSMINALGVNGHAEEALQYYQQLLSAGLSPDTTTFIVALSACSHSGLISPALQLYQSIPHYNLSLNAELVTCMVDVLARAGRLQEAEEVAIQSGIVDDVMWYCVLGACRIYKDVERAERIGERLMKMDPKNAVPYIVLTNIYTSLGLTAQAQAMRERRATAGVDIQLGISSTIINGVTTSFTAADFSHPLGSQLYDKCLEISSRIASAGYQPDLSWATRQDSHDARALSLCLHSERIAIALNLLTTPEGSRIRITKNLRVCGDCHEATKVIARVYGREISVRDRSRWHEFRTDGTCSCRDYF